MLTLTREVGEKIVIGDDVVVTVISVPRTAESVSALRPRARSASTAPRSWSGSVGRISKRELPSDRLAFAAYAARQANERSASRKEEVVVGG